MTRSKVLPYHPVVLHQLIHRVAGEQGLQNRGVYDARQRILSAAELPDERAFRLPSSLLWQLRQFFADNEQSSAIVCSEQKD